MPLTPDDLYLRLGQMVAQMPNLHGPDPVPRETNEWLGRALALVELIADLGDKISMNVSMQSLNTVSRQRNAQAIESIVMSALARAELRASAEVQGRFIPVGSPYQAFVAVGNVLRLANEEILIVDAYADATLLSDFATQASQGVTIRLLVNGSNQKPDLEPAIQRWRQEYADQRPLAVRLAQPHTLHDRIIIVDQQAVWSIGQSFNGIGKRSPTAIVKTPADMATEKIAAYEQIWQSARQI